METPQDKSVIINETSRRTHKRTGSTLVERMRRDPARRLKMDEALNKLQQSRTIKR